MPQEAGIRARPEEGGGGLYRSGTQSVLVSRGSRVSLRVAELFPFPGKKKEKQSFP